MIECIDCVKCSQCSTYHIQSLFYSIKRVQAIVIAIITMATLWSSSRKGTVPTLFIVLRDSIRSMPFSLRRKSILDVVPMDSGSRNLCLATQAIHYCGCGWDLGGPFIFGLTFESAMVPNNFKMNFLFENSDLLSQAKS